MERQARVGYQRPASSEERSRETLGGAVLVSPPALGQ